MTPLEQEAKGLADGALLAVGGDLNVAHPADTLTWCVVRWPRSPWTRTSTWNSRPPSGLITISAILRPVC